MAQQQIYLISEEGIKVQFRRDLSELCEIISNSNLDEDIPVFQVSTAVLENIQVFCEAHRYDGSSMKYVFPFISDNLHDHVDPVSFKFIQNLIAAMTNTEDRIKCLSPYLDAAFYLGFTKLKKIINVAIQVPFYCGSTESEQQEFIQKWRLQQDEISEEMLKSVADNFGPLFHAYRESNTQKLNAIFDRYQAAKKK